jgi:hypothetical protein
LKSGKPSDDIKVVLRILDDELTRWLLKLLLEHPEGVNIAWATALYYRNKIDWYDPKERRNAYQRVYRRIKTLEKYGFVITDSPKNSRFKIIKLNPARAMHVINLIMDRPSSVSQTRKQLRKKDPEAILKIDADRPDLPIYLSTKVKALQLLIKNKKLNEEQKKELIKLFKEYIEDVRQRRIILIPKKEYRGELEPIILDYEVRFTSKRKAKRNKRQYRHIWKDTAKRYRWAVVITLTIDPKKVPNLWEARYLAQAEFNRYMTGLNKFLTGRARKYGRRVRRYSYARFIEYQENGMIHYHHVVFGVRWIKNENELAQKNWRLGFVDVQTLVNVRGKWRFKKKPKDYDERYRRYKRHKTGKETDGGSPLYASPEVYFYFSSNYAGIEDPSQLESYDDYDLLNMALHWALNTRFWTNSRDLQLPPEERESTGCYEFYMCVYEFEILTILEGLSKFKPPPF